MNFVQAKNYNKLAGKKNKLIVIHDMEYPEKSNSAEWCADFFAGRNGLTAPKASAHYCIDNDSIVQCVKDEDVAWHTPGKIGDYINNISIGIEHAGYAKQTREQWLDDFSKAMLLRSAEFVAGLCKKYGITPKKLTVEELKAGDTNGICGHVDCTKATGTGSHTDPGPGFPWDWYIEQVQSFFQQ